MAFWGSEFIFDGISCSEFGLMVYSMDLARQEDVVVHGGSSISKSISGRYDSLFYGITNDTPLEYTLVFGATPDSIDQNECLDRYEIEAVSAWLLFHNTRKWLAIVQNDMEPFRYLCTISDLKIITYGEMPWAFSCKVTCDSQFAYTFPVEYKYSIDGNQTINVFNRSSYNGFYKPQMDITLYSNNLYIQNASDNNRVFAFTDMQIGNPINIHIDNKNCIITNDIGIDIYSKFNMHFMRFVRGDNVLNISGNAIIKFVCEFPVLIGG